MSDRELRFWGRVVGATLIASSGVFVAVRAALAVPGGETRPALSFSGTLTGASGPQTLRFVFRRPMVTTPVCEGSATVNPGAGGQFTASIPIDACPATLFDGSDVVFDVAVGGVAIATDQAINPVPYARYADRVGTPDCPVGYNRDASAMGIVLCRKGLDEVVRVGSGASAFWIDRYEASVWQNRDGTGTQYGASGDNYPSTFSDNGQIQRDNFVFAVSRTGVLPSSSITWFQASSACRASGKRLMSRDEWFAASSGTTDPGVSSGNAGSCVTSGNRIREAANGVACSSVWGAQDMIGNVFEWTDEWYAGLNSGVSEPFNAWPSIGSVSYGSDLIWNVDSRTMPARIGAETPENEPEPRGRA